MLGSHQLLMAVRQHFRRRMELKARLKTTTKQAVRDWLDDLIEGQLEISDEFKAKVGRAKQEIAAGVHSRVRQPQAGQ